MPADAPSSAPHSQSFRGITQCRMCSGREIEPLLDLGNQYLTGVFPRDPNARLTCGPLQLSLCRTCGLVQLLHSFNPSELYGDHYGYRSSLNKSMVDHLRSKAIALDSFVSAQADDVVLDIGSNDGTLLGCYPERGQTFVGFDPCAARFRAYYRPDIVAVPTFFSSSAFREALGTRKAKIVTSIAMFYDLEQPLDFVQQVANTLDDSGIWHLEQSYLPAMLEATAYDTICHEHLEYYGLRQIKWMADKVGLKIVEVSRNDVNGGSFAVTLSKWEAPYPVDEENVAALLRYESEIGLNTPEPFDSFRQRVFRHREELQSALAAMRRDGLKVLGYGASTKGNVLLQFCGINVDQLPAIAEVNQDKFGCFTPGTAIPIISEDEARQLDPDCMLVLPWHFRTNIVAREKEFLRGGGSLLFPLPHVESVTGCGER